MYVLINICFPKSCKKRVYVKYISDHHTLLRCDRTPSRLTWNKTRAPLVFKSQFSRFLQADKKFPYHRKKLNIFQTF